MEELHFCYLESAQITLREREGTKKIIHWDVHT